MTIKELIQKAKKGGWKGNIYDTCSNCEEMMMSSCSTHLERALLDSKFWKALSKAEGWEKKEVTLKLSKMTITGVGRSDFERKKQVSTYIRKSPNAWKHKMRGMIEHLINGKSIESYIKNL